MSARPQIHPVAYHFIDRLYEAEIKALPYPYTYVTRVFPQPYYQEMLQNLPPDEVYTDRQFDNRMMASVKDLGSFWKSLSNWMISNEVIGALYEMFKLDAPRVHAEIRLVRDTKGYRIKPHTDIKAKLLSLLFYLPENEEHPEEGTTVMVPKEKDFTSDGTRRYEYENFENVYTAPFLPNTMLGFPRSNVSFHGVSGTTIAQRNVLLLNLYRVK